MDTIPNNSLMLVGILPTPKDFEIARMLGWYRIPLRFAPKIIDVDYFAFYQGGKFGEIHRWQIEFIAEYRGHELTTRGELLRDEGTHPRAKEEYFKVQLGPLVQIPQPIKSDKWKRITFIYTTGELFNRAHIINDLVVRSEDRQILWKSLRERIERRDRYGSGQQKDFTLDPALLEMIMNCDPTPNDVDLENY